MSVRHATPGSGTRASATPRRESNGTPGDDHVVVLFGATGDLAGRELLPGLFRLAKALPALRQKRQVVTLGFREPPLQMFALDPDTRDATPSNKLVIAFDDPGWIAARFQAKEPGAALRLGEATMTFRYADSFCARHALAGYERLILEAMLGDQSLFTRADGIERLWELSTPLLNNPPPVEPYSPGSWGPDSIDRLLAPHHWYLPDR